MAVIVIIGLIVGVGSASVSSNLKRSNREAVANDLQLFTSNLADAYYDLGAPSIDPTSPDAISEFKRYLSVLQSDYLSVTFDMDSVVATANGFEVDIASPLDVYENQYHCWFTTVEGVPNYIMVASGGEDRKLNTAGYASQNYGDDIVLVIKP